MLPALLLRWYASESGDGAMRLLEYQAKRVLARQGLAAPPGEVVERPEQAEQVAAELGGAVYVKAQVRSGGRGKRGGVLRAATPAEAAAAARRLLGARLDGLPVRKALVEAEARYAEAVFVGLLIDHHAAQPRLLLSARGGVDVETSGGVASALVDPLVGPRPYQVRDLARQAGVRRQSVEGLQRAVAGLYAAFTSHGCTLAEINPLAIDAVGNPLVLDAHLHLDDAALSRVPGIEDLLADTSGESVEEEIKRRYDFDYVALDPEGDVGILSTGAGGTMMLVDAVGAAGGRPINFVDVRTGQLRGDPTRLVALLRQLAQAPNLKVLLVSVFAGITDMQVFAECLLAALTKAPLGCAFVIRLQGVRAEVGRRLLSHLGPSHFATLDEAAAAAVAAARAGGGR